MQRQASSVTQIKSILKPTVPLTPPKAIPTFDETRKRTGKKSPKHDAGEELLIDFSTPAPRHVFSMVTGTENIQDPFSPIRKTAGPQGVAPPLLQEGKVEAAITEDEAEKARKAHKQAILDRRAARRTSMANRRVSFAPEATLHTWNVVEIVEESTTSSASNSTRRQSSMTAAKPPNRPEQSSSLASDQSEPPSTPPAQAQEPLVKASPADQQNWNARGGRRRSSRMSNINVEGVDHIKSSPASTYSESSAVEDSSPIHVEDSIHSSSDDDDGDTAMSMDDVTGQTVQSQISSSSTASSLDGRLRRAAAVAGTRGIEYDENGDDLSMELAEGTITNAFQPWANGQPRARVQDLSAMQDQENVNPFSPAFKVQADATILQASDATEEDESEGATMDMTVAAGGIISEDTSVDCSPAVPTSVDKPVKSDDVVEDADDSVDCDDGQGDTMDMTAAAGCIIFRDTTTGRSPLPTTFEEKRDSFVKGVEDSVLDSRQGDTMDMTVVTGGIISDDKATKCGTATPISLGKLTNNIVKAGEAPTLDESQGDTMDMAVTAGGIISHDKVTKSRSASPISLRNNPNNVATDANELVLHDPTLYNTIIHDPALHNPVFRDGQDDTMDKSGAASGITSKDGVTKSTTASPMSLRKDSDNIVNAADVSISHDKQEQQVKKISLQEFLNMTNIHFMELSTTKRRHTLAPGPPSQPLQESSSTSNKGACFAAAATTVPLLDLYQHASRELKSYISSGRKVIRTIEQETLAEQPALFREYVDARPDVKAAMDNQFRNSKANARLQSKESWYLWRRELIEGLRTGLNGIKAGMEEDAQSLSRQEAILETAVPELVKQHEELEQEAGRLHQRAEDFESVDHEAVDKARNQLESVDEEVSKKMALLEQLQQQMKEKVEALSAAEELKVEFQGQITEAQKVQDECRGWKVEEVIKYKDRVEAIEKKTGWSLVTTLYKVSAGAIDYGPTATMQYRNALRLFFYPVVFQEPKPQNGQRNAWAAACDAGPSPPISLTYAPIDEDATTSSELTTEQRFFLQLLQGQVQTLAASPRGTASCNTLVTLVSQGWDLASKVSEEIRRLEMIGITFVKILSDEKFKVQCLLVFHPERSWLYVEFTLTATPTSDGSISTSLQVEALPKWGFVEGLLAGGGKASKVREALNKQANSKSIGGGAWADAVWALDEWITSQKESFKDSEKEAKVEKEKSETEMEKEKSETPASRPVLESAAPAAPAVPEVSTPTRAPVAQKRGLKRPVPMDEVMEEAAARKEEVRRLEEEEFLLMSAGKTPGAHGRRPGALRRSP
jgi:Spc7 kinetochore protein/Knl1 RWD C-terminal domain